MKPHSLCMIMAAGALGLALQAAASNLPYQVSIDREGPEEEVLEQVSAALTGEAKVAPALASEVLKGFDRYIDKKVEKEKKRVTLYPQVMFDVTKACAAKGWPAGDIRELLIHIQGEIDDEGRSATAMKRSALAEIARGGRLKNVVETLEKSEVEDGDDR